VGSVLYGQRIGKDIQQLERVQRRAARFVKKRLSPYNFCHWSAQRTWLVALVRTSQTLSFDGFLQGVRLMTFRPFLWITSQFHHGILEPPMKINLCHCQFVLMLLTIHFSSDHYRLEFPPSPHCMAVRLSQSIQSFHGGLQSSASSQALK